jgi:anti-sigma B factor antagonist
MSIARPTGTRDDSGRELAVVEITGEADLTTTHRLRAQLEELAGRTDSRVLVDLSGATFIDSSTLGALAVSAKAFATTPGRFAVVCPTGEVRTMFELTALERVVPIYGTRAEALAAMDDVSRPT